MHLINHIRSIHHNDCQKVVLVLGGGGFLGFHIGRAFSQAGYRVYGLIRSDTQSNRLRGEEIIPVLGTVDDGAWLPQISYEQFDFVVTATEDFLNPVVHAKHLMDRIVGLQGQNKGKRLHVVYTAGIKDFGSSGLKGDPKFHIISETSPRESVFGGLRTKMMEDLFANTTFDATAMTPAMIYGKGHSWYAEWFREALESNVIHLVGSPNTVWHGIDVEDVAQAFVHVASKSGPAVFKQNYLIANDKFETVGEIVEAISKATGGGHKIEHVTPTPTMGHTIATYSQWIDNRKLRALGWAPRKPTLCTGMRQYVESFRAALTDPFYKPAPTWDQINAMAAALATSNAKK